MNVKDIIWHLDNFINTNRGWSDFLGGLTKFFSQWDDYLKWVQEKPGTDEKLGGFAQGAGKLQELFAGSSSKPAPEQPAN